VTIRTAADQHVEGQDQQCISGQDRRVDPEHRPRSTAMTAGEITIHHIVV
jgi:hypothetical protein